MQGISVATEIVEYTPSFITLLWHKAVIPFSHTQLLYMSNQNCNILPWCAVKGRAQTKLWLGPKWGWAEAAPGDGRVSPHLRHLQCFAPAADICEGLLALWVSKSSTCDTKKRSCLLLLTTASLFYPLPANFLQTTDWRQYAGYTLPSRAKC